MRTYSISEAAHLLGLSTATVSRRLAPDRATRGRSARLSVDELTEIAAAMHLDPEAVRRRALASFELGPGMPADAERWAAAAIERHLVEHSVTHRSRIPVDILSSFTSEAEEAVVVPEPWGTPEDWEPIKSTADVDKLLPPLDS